MVDKYQEGAARSSDSPDLRELKAEHDAIMDEYCEWRRNRIDSYRLAEDHEYRRKLDRCRRKIASAKASATDLVSKMRLLTNWSDPVETGTRFEFETAHGAYSLWVNDVTYAWVVRTPDGAFEGPFSQAQEAADWAADDWYEIFCDPEKDAP